MMRPNGKRDFSAALFLAGLGVAVTLASRPAGRLPVYGAYRVDLFSQVFKGLLSAGVLPRGLPLLEPERDSRSEARGVLSFAWQPVPWA